MNERVSGCVCTWYSVIKLSVPGTRVIGYSMVKQSRISVLKRVEIHVMRVPGTLWSNSHDLVCVNSHE